MQGGSDLMKMKKLKKTGTYSNLGKSVVWETSMFLFANCLAFAYIDGLDKILEFNLILLAVKILGLWKFNTWWDKKYGV